MIINVTAPPSPYTGIDPTGASDSQPKLQEMINGKVGTTSGPRGVLYFPKGRYRIDSTLLFQNQTGHQLIGSGLPKPVLNGSNEQGAESVLVWGGPDEGTMIKYEGAGLVWSGLGLWGANTRHVDSSSSSSSSTTNPVRAKYGINLSRPSGGGVGTGKAWFDSILVADCDVAIGTESETKRNCDTLGFGYCWFEDCGIGLSSMHEQAMDYSFQYVRAVRVGKIFQVFQPPKPNPDANFPTTGGKIFTQAVAVETSGTTVFDLQGGGTNTAFHQIGGVVINGSATNTTLLLSEPPAGGTHSVRFTDGHFRNSTSLTVDRSSGAAGRTTVELVGCRGVGLLEGQILLKGRTSSARIVLFVRDCDITGLTNDDVEFLLDSNSQNYRAWSLDNWTFESGVVGNTDDASP